MPVRRPFRRRRRRRRGGDDDDGSSGVINYEYRWVIVFNPQPLIDLWNQYFPPLSRTSQFTQQVKAQERARNLRRPIRRGGHDWGSTSRDLSKASRSKVPIEREREIVEAPRRNFGPIPGPLPDVGLRMRLEAEAERRAALTQATREQFSRVRHWPGPGPYRGPAQIFPASWFSPGPGPGPSSPRPRVRNPSGPSTFPVGLLSIGRGDQSELPIRGTGAGGVVTYLSVPNAKVEGVSIKHIVRHFMAAELAGSEQGLQRIRNRTPIRTGRLASSIGYDLNDRNVAVGTRVQYAPFVTTPTGESMIGMMIGWRGRYGDTIQQRAKAKAYALAQRIL